MRIRLVWSVIFTVIILSKTIAGYALDESEPALKREISAGYNQSRGNTDSSEFSLTARITRSLRGTELSAGGEVYYSSSESHMDSQKWRGLARYAHDFGERKKWFNSCQVMASHDRFADIDHRIIPSAGFGYWIFRDKDLKLSIEDSLGYEFTRYRGNKADDKEFVSMFRLYLEKKVFDKAMFSQDFSAIPSLEGGGVRISSVSEFSNPLAKGLDMSVRLIADYDSEPSEGVKKTDTRIITALKYSF